MASESAPPQLEWTTGVANFTHVREHAKALNLSSWDAVRKLRNCATCADLCELVDKKLRARFLKKRWKNRDPELLRALESAHSVRFIVGDGMTCSMHTSKRHNSDYHAQVLLECEDRCPAHESASGCFQDCGCATRSFAICSNVQARLLEYRRVMCLRQLLTLDYREYKTLAASMAGGDD